MLVFYRKLPTYNPQFVYSKPYSEDSKSKSRNYGQGSWEYGYVTVSEDGRRYPLDCLNFKQVNNATVDERHPTQKPVDLLEYLIRTYTDAGELVLDATMGSGSTGVAAVNTGMNFIGFETEEKFYKIARARIEAAQAAKESVLF